MATNKRQIWIAMSPADVAKLDRFAKALRLSRSATAGLLIVTAMKTAGKPETLMTRHIEIVKGAEDG